MARTTTGRLVNALTYPVRVLGGGLVEDGDARVHVEEDAYVLTVELAAADCGDFDLSWAGGELTVAAACDGTAYEESFRFPDVVDPDAITATYRDEVLTVRLPVRGQGAGQRVPVTAD
jgi:HSP20 family molecular chaperone IbpA